MKIWALFTIRFSSGVTGETVRVDAGYHVVGMKADAPDIDVAILKIEMSERLPHEKVSCRWDYLQRRRALAWRLDGKGPQWCRRKLL